MALHKHKGPLAEINIVPYIDVMLVLLVIFMITAPLLTQGVNVALPQAQAKPLNNQTADPIILSIDQEGVYYLNINDQPQKPLVAEDLQQEVISALKLAQDKNIKRDVYVKADKNVNYGNVVKAMVLLQKAGAAQVGLMTQPIEENK